VFGQLPPHPSLPPHLPEQAGTQTQVPFEHFFDCVVQLFPHEPQLVSLVFILTQPVPEQ
jgi:hypothetical protein